MNFLHVVLKDESFEKLVFDVKYEVKVVVQYVICLTVMCL